MILFNRWIIARVDRAVKRAEPSALCNGWILTDQDDGYRCTLPRGHAGFCDPDGSARRERNYAAKSYAFGVGPKPPELKQPDPMRSIKG